MQLTIWTRPPSRFPINWKFWPPHFSWCLCWNGGSPRSNGSPSVCWLAEWPWWSWSVWEYLGFTVKSRAAYQSAKWTTSTEEAIELAAAGRQLRHHPSSSQNTSDALPLGVPHASKLQLRISSQESFWVGFGSVLGACVLSGYSGVYLEMVVKRPGDSLWLRNFQLCFLSAFIALAIALVWQSKQNLIRLI